MLTLRNFRPDPKPEKREKKKSIPLKQKTAIRKKSKRQHRDDDLYSKRAKVWLENKICKCCNESAATQVHHKIGRKGYADEWALLRGIKLIHDERFWLEVCSDCHIEIEKNPEWAYQEGYSITRANILTK